MKTHNISPELEKARAEIEGICKNLGLNTSIEPDKKTIFKMLDFSELNMVAAYSGFPTRYPHWKFGMEYEHLQKQLGWGYGRLYELVINTTPPIAYLLEYNEPVQQMMVMAHVYAHVDFFANNYLFKETNRNMLNMMADHSSEIERYINRYGLETVEKFLDVCLSIDNLIDPFSVRMKREQDKDGSCSCGKGGCDDLGKIKVKDYMDSFVNPESVVEAEKKKNLEEKLKEPKSPLEPQRDVLKYIIDNADKLKDWERHILSMIREESYYFAPQRQTKIMNEGWATFWHCYVMARLGYAKADGIISFARTHSGVVGMKKPGILTNPYTVGLMMYRYISEAWDKGNHGKEYEKVTDIKIKKEWDTKEMKGMEKIFEVRKHKDDIGFIREFMTPEFIEDNELFIYKYDEEGVPRIHERDPEKIKNMFLHQMTNGGQPIIYVEDGNYNNRKELLLSHEIHGYQLDIPDARRTIENLYSIWKRPVYLNTVFVKAETNEEIPCTLIYDGKEHKAVRREVKKDGCGGSCDSCGGHH